MKNPYLRLVRPFTLIAAFIGGILLYYAFAKTFNYNGFILGFIFALLQGGGQAYNQSVPEEVQIDVLNKKTYRPVVSGEITINEGRMFASFLLILAIFTTFYTRDLIFTFLVSMGAFFAWQYTDYPIRAKRFFIINNAWQAFARGFLPIITSYYFATGSIDIFSLIISFVLFVWIFGAQTTKDFGDIEGDSFFGINTFPVVLGCNRAKYVTCAFSILAFAILSLFILIGLIPFKYTYVNFLLIPTFVMCVKLDCRSHASEIWEKRGIENSGAWGIYYATLGLWFLMIFLVEVV